MQSADPSTAPSPHLQVRPDWLARREEEILEPDLPIVDPHHHRLQVPPGGTTPADVAAAVKAAKLPVTVLIPELGKSYSLGK